MKASATANGATSVAAGDTGLGAAHDRRSTKSIHAMEGGAACALLSTSAQLGLTDGEAARRLERDGPNRLPGPRRLGRLAIALAQLTNSMVALLAAGAVISLAIGEQLDAAVIMAVVVVNAALGYFQEQQAENATTALLRLVSGMARVLRDGTVREVPVESVAVGDIALLAAGDRVPADGRILSAEALEIDEASLTGESLPVAKRAEPPVDAAADLADRLNMAHAGTVVTRGAGAVAVAATAADTEMGAITAAAGAPSPRTPLQQRLDRLARTLLWVALVTCGGLTALEWAYGESLADSLLVRLSRREELAPESQGVSRAALTSLRRTFSSEFPLSASGRPRVVKPRRFERRPSAWRTAKR